MTTLSEKNEEMSPSPKKKETLFYHEYSSDSGSSFRLQQMRNSGNDSQHSSPIKLKQRQGHELDLMDIKDLSPTKYSVKSEDDTSQKRA